MRPGKSFSSRSVQARLLVVVGALFTVWLVAGWFFTDQRFEELLIHQLASRAEDAANAISYAIDSSPSRDSLQRFVSAVGANPEIEDIVVAYGNPPVVLVAKQIQWSGKALAELPDRPHIAADLEKAMVSGRSFDPNHKGGTLVDYTIPIEVIDRNAPSVFPQKGAIMIHMRTQPVRAALERSALQVQIINAGTAMALTIIILLVVRQLVLKPVSKIQTAVGRRSAGDIGAYVPDLGTTEIGELGKSLNAMIKAIDDGQQANNRLIATLTNQQKALDKFAIVAETDAAGRITYVNDQFCSVSRYSREELLGQDHRIVNSGHHPKSFFRELWQAISSGSVWRGEIRNRAKDGSIYWVDTTIVPFLDSRGRPEKYLAIRAVITERKAAEEKLTEAIRARSEFVSVISHELRTPLTVIDQAIEIVQDGSAGPLNEDQSHYMSIAARNVKRLATLINDVLDFQKSDYGRMDLVFSTSSLNAIAEEVASSFQPECDQKGVRIVRELDPLLPDINMDATRITQVLYNLFSNAVKFTSQGAITIRTARRGNVARLEVQDSGVGISEADVGKLFQPFSQVGDPMARKTGSTGLGLAICKKIVDLHQGTMGVDSVVGEGSTFYVLLPIVERRRRV